MTMTYSKNGEGLTESFEGCRLTAYQDSKGIWTIGVGHTGSNVCEGMTITQAEADTLLLFDIARTSAAVNRLVTVVLTQDEFDALVDFAFNVGIGALQGSTLLRKLNAGDFQGAAAEFVKWDHAGAVVLAGLLRRRQAETDIFEQGIKTGDTVSNS